MANIRVDLDYTLHDGADVAFNAPCDCTEVTGLIIYYPQLDGTITSNTFTFRDAHKHDLGSLTELFVSGARVKVNVDIANGFAYIQNADTNAYLEAQLAGKRPNTWLPTLSDIGAAPDGFGLGAWGNGTRTADSPAAVDEMFTNGWWTYNSSQNLIPGFVGTDYGYGFTMNYGPERGRQFVNPVIYHKESLLTRTMEHQVWTEWEWINPPMQLGVEYRTTERYNDKPVYTRLVYAGALTHGMSTICETSNPNGCIRYSASVNGYIVPSSADINTHYVSCRVEPHTSGICAIFLSNGTLGNVDTYIQFWYVK